MAGPAVPNRRAPAGTGLASTRPDAMTILLWAVLPHPWNYCAAVFPVAGFFATRWAVRRWRSR
jgi:hypothetical protein